MPEQLDVAFTVTFELTLYCPLGMEKITEQPSSDVTVLVEVWVWISVMVI